MSLRLIVTVTYHYRTEVVKYPISSVPLDTVQMLLWQQWSFALKRSFISGSWASECILLIWIAINKINSYFCQLQVLWENNRMNRWGLIQSCMFLFLVLLRWKGKETCQEKGQCQLGAAGCCGGRLSCTSGLWLPAQTPPCTRIPLALGESPDSQFCFIYKVRAWIQMISKGPSSYKIPWFCFLRQNL